MSLPLSAKRPTILAGLNTSLLGSPGVSLRAAESLQFFAADLDLRRSWRFPAARHLGANGADNVVRTRSVWIPGAIVGPFVESRTEALWSLLEESVSTLGLRSIIIPHRSDVTRGTWLGAESRKRLAASSNGLVRHAIGIRGTWLRRGHDQLMQLDMIRHSAEEWDLDIALDLTGDVPHYLEAEAAMLRILPRLVLVRLPSWVSANGELNTNDPISRRVVSILADQGYGGSISIVPTRSPVHLPWTATVPTSGEDWTRSMILDQYLRQQPHDLTSPYISPELYREPY